MENDIPVMLPVMYGKDQETGIDNVIQQMHNSGQILTVEKKEALSNFVKYKILFDSPFSLYLFGWKSANLHIDYFKSESFENLRNM